MSNVIDLTVHQKKGTKPPPAASDHDVIVLDAAVAQVRAILQKFRAVEGRACAHMLDLGDVLIPVRRVAGYRAWGTFLRDCGLPKRDSQIAIQLAKARTQIEAENAKRASCLSIREALALIRPKKPKPEPEQCEPGAKDPVTSTTIADVLAWLLKASQADKRRVAVALAQDTAAMKKILPVKALPPKASPKQVFDRAMAMLTSDETPSVTH